MQVQVVWHHRGPDDANGYVQAVLEMIGIESGHKAAQHGAQVRTCHEEFDEKAAANDRDERQGGQLQQTYSAALQREQQERVRGRDGQDYTWQALGEDD